MTPISITDFKLSAPPQVKTSAAGKQYATINGSYWAGKDKDGKNEYQNVSVTVFGNAVNRVAGWVKGNLINVNGKAGKCRHYMNQQGQVVTVLDVLASEVEKPFGSNATTTQQPAAQPAQDFTSGAAGFDETENDLPF